MFSSASYSMPNVKRIIIIAVYIVQIHASMYRDHLTWQARSANIGHGIDSHYNRGLKPEQETQYRRRPNPCPILSWVFFILPPFPAQQTCNVLLKATYCPQVAAVSCTQKKRDLDRWPMTLKLNRLSEVGRYRFVQNVIELSAAVCELSWSQRNKQSWKHCSRRYRGQYIHSNN